MPSIHFNYGNYALWELYHKVTFDGLNKHILVNSDVTELDIKEDVYSAWKEWVSSFNDNAKWDPAIRSTGGDPTVGSSFSGDIYFLINDWKLLIDFTKVRVTGVLFSDNFDTAYYAYDLTPQYAVEVSSIVNTVSEGVSASAVTPILLELQNRIGEMWQVDGLDSSNNVTITDESITVGNITVTIGQPNRDTTTLSRS